MGGKSRKKKKKGEEKKRIKKAFSTQRKPTLMITACRWVCRATKVKGRNPMDNGIRRQGSSERSMLEM